MSKTRQSIEARAIGVCYVALHTLNGNDESLTWVDRQELVAELRAVVNADKARERRRNKVKGKR